MTSFAPSEVIACPHCKHLALRRRLRSVNFYGSTRWSDGYLSCLTGLPTFTRCSSCQGVFWLEDAEVIGVLPDDRHDRKRTGLAASLKRVFISSPSAVQEVPDVWRWAQPVDHPDVDALVIGIENSAHAPLERERRIRRLLWWRFNDRFRRSSPAAGGVSATIREKHEKSNLHRLLDLAEKSDGHESIERVEILRELGRFDEARDVLAQVRSGVAGRDVLAVKIEARDPIVCVTEESSW